MRLFSLFFVIEKFNVITVGVRVMVDFLASIDLNRVYKNRENCAESEKNGCKVEFRGAGSRGSMCSK